MVLKAALQSTLDKLQATREELHSTRSELRVTLEQANLLLDEREAATSFFQLAESDASGEESSLEQCQATGRLIDTEVEAGESCSKIQFPPLVVGWRDIHAAVGSLPPPPLVNRGLSLSLDDLTLVSSSPSGSDVPITPMGLKQLVAT